MRLDVAADLLRLIERLGGLQRQRGLVGGDLRAEDLHQALADLVERLQGLLPGLLGVRDPHLVPGRPGLLRPKVLVKAAHAAIVPGDSHVVQHVALRIAGLVQLPVVDQHGLFRVRELGPPLLDSLGFLVAV